MLHDIIVALHPETQFARMTGDVTSFLRSKNVPNWLMDELANAYTSESLLIGPLDLPQWSRLLREILASRTDSFVIA